MRVEDLHGSAPDHCPVALILIDVINAMDFPGSERLAEQAVDVARNIADLKSAARKHGVPVIYVNDNFGRWRSDFRSLVEHCSRPPSLGRAVVELLRPEEDDYFVLKPKHSGFLATTLETLLEYLGARTVVLTGFAGNICVLFTANDAYMRDLRLIVPADCVASNSQAENGYALEQMRDILKADIGPASDIEWPQLLDPDTSNITRRAD